MRCGNHRESSERSMDSIVNDLVASPGTVTYRRVATLVTTLTRPEPAGWPSTTSAPRWSPGSALSGTATENGTSTDERDGMVTVCCPKRPQDPTSVWTPASLSTV